MEGGQPGTETDRQHYVYDAWNRLTAVYDDDLGNPDDKLVEYEYDGLNQRIEKRLTPPGGTASNVDYYYDEDWRLLEEAIHDGSDVLQTMNHYVWDVTYIDAPVVRFQDGDGDGTWDDPSDSERYYTFDANGNITAVIDRDTGNAIERYGYDPYGQATVYDSSWANGAAPTEDALLYAGYFFARLGLRMSVKSELCTRSWVHHPV